MMMDRDRVKRDWSRLPLSRLVIGSGRASFCLLFVASGSRVNEYMHAIQAINADDIADTQQQVLSAANSKHACTLAGRAGCGE